MSFDGARAPPFLSGLTDDDARDLRALGRARRFGAGETIIHQGDDPGGVSVLVSGRVKVVALAPQGREVILAFLGPGDLVGEVAALAGRPRSCAVRTLEPVELLAITAADFRAFLGTHAAVSLDLVFMLIERLRVADGTLMAFAGHDVVGRVACRLVELCERFGQTREEGIEIDLTISQEELAAWTGSSREAVVKAIRLLRELGWIANRRRRIVVRDVEALRRYAA